MLGPRQLPTGNSKKIGNFQILINFIFDFLENYDLSTIELITKILIRKKEEGKAGGEGGGAFYGNHLLKILSILKKHDNFQNHEQQKQLLWKLVTLYTDLQIFESPLTPTTSTSPSSPLSVLMSLFYSFGYEMCDNQQQYLGKNRIF